MLGTDVWAHREKYFCFIYIILKYEIPENFFRLNYKWNVKISYIYSTYIQMSAPRLCDVAFMGLASPRVSRRRCKGATPQVLYSCVETDSHCVNFNDAECPLVALTHAYRKTRPASASRSLPERLKPERRWTHRDGRTKSQQKILYIGNVVASSVGTFVCCTRKRLVAP